MVWVSMTKRTSFHWSFCLSLSLSPVLSLTLSPVCVWEGDWVWSQLPKHVNFGTCQTGWRSIVLYMLSLASIGQMYVWHEKLLLAGGGVCQWMVYEHLFQNVLNVCSVVFGCTHFVLSTYYVCCTHFKNKTKTVCNPIVINDYDTVIKI